MALDKLKDLCGQVPLQRWFHRTGEPIVVVLMYHDLRADTDFTNWLRVAVSDFEAQLDAIAELGDFIPPAALLAPDELPRDRLSFLVTFDDGYLNNALLAAPLLERRRIPALYFVSTGPLVSRQPFWTDIVVTPIQSRRLRSLDLQPLGFDHFEFRSGGESERWVDVQRLLVAIKSVGNDDNPRVAGLLAWLQDEFRETLDEHLPRFLPLSSDQVSQMAAGSFAHFGSHGHDHRILPRLGDEELVRSLERSRSILTELTGDPIEQLAYPNGDKDERVMAAAATAGYRRGYTVRPGLVAGRLRALDLPRVSVGAFDSPARLRFKIKRQLLAWRLRRRAGDLELRSL